MGLGGRGGIEVKVEDSWDPEEGRRTRVAQAESLSIPAICAVQAVQRGKLLSNCVSWWAKCHI